MTHPAIKKRGADPAVPEKDKASQGTDEHKLEQGLEESMAGSDAVSITQPAPAKDDAPNAPDADEVSEDDNEELEVEEEAEEEEEEDDLEHEKDDAEEKEDEAPPSINLTSLPTMQNGGAAVEAQPSQQSQPPGA